jgi:hypothetical protein
VVAVAAVLLVLLLGVGLGARGMRRLGAAARGPWRPGVALMGVLAAAGALLTLARGQWWSAAALAFLAAGALGAARRRAAPAAAPAAAGGMSRAEAAELLGVRADATAAEADAAFRRLILKLHPDQGGTSGLAAKLQEARRAMAGR